MKCQLLGKFPPIELEYLRCFFLAIVPLGPTDKTLWQGVILVATRICLFYPTYFVFSDSGPQRALMRMRTIFGTNYKTNWNVHLLPPTGTQNHPVIRIH